MQGSGPAMGTSAEPTNGCPGPEKGGEKAGIGQRYVPGFLLQAA
jgi:hypothetical protein